MGWWGFHVVLISYLSVTRENKLWVQVLALMGFHVSPVGFLSPPNAAAGAFWCYTEPTASGESRRQLVITFFILCLQGVVSGAPTGSQPWKYNLWGHCGFWSALAEGVNIFPHITLFSRSIATLLSSSTRLSSLGAVNPKSSPSMAQELQSMSLGHTQGTTGQLWPRSRAEGQQEAQQEAGLRPFAECSTWAGDVCACVSSGCNSAWAVCSPNQWGTHLKNAQVVKQLEY